MCGRCVVGYDTGTRPVPTDVWYMCRGPVRNVPHIASRRASAYIVPEWLNTMVIRYACNGKPDSRCVAALRTEGPQLCRKRKRKEEEKEKKEKGKKKGREDEN